MTIPLPRFDSLLGRAIRLPLKLIPNDTVLTVKSGIIKGMKWRVGSNTHGCWLGTYERRKQEVVAALVKPRMQIVDIGANAGFYTLAFSRLSGDAGHVWAFEPFAENSSNLQLHMRLNAITNVTIIQAAVSNSDSISGFDAGGHNSLGRLLNATSSYMVPTVSLDSMRKAGTLPIPDLVKMDVEGAESRVLQGSRELMAVGATTWLIALHGRAQREECLSILAEFGYEVTEFETDELLAVPRRRATGD